MKGKSPELLLDLILETLTGKKLKDERRYWEEGSIHTGFTSDPVTGMEFPHYEIATWDTNELWRSLKVKGVETDLVTLKAFLYQLAYDGNIFIYGEEKSRSHEVLNLEITAQGVAFLKNGGYVKRRNDEEAMKAKEAEILEEQLITAKENTRAAKSSAKFALWLLFATGINIVLFGIQVIYDISKDDKPPVIKISDVVRRELEQNQRQMIQLQDQINLLQSRLPADTLKN